MEKELEPTAEMAAKVCQDVGDLLQKTIEIASEEAVLQEARIWGLPLSREGLKSKALEKRQSWIRKAAKEIKL